jgi:hypothetical protein
MSSDTTKSDVDGVRPGANPKQMLWALDQITEVFLKLKFNQDQVDIIHRLTHRLAEAALVRAVDADWKKGAEESKQSEQVERGKSARS